MSSCIIHVDGSYYPASDSKKQNGLGWGIIAQHDNQDHESAGGYATSRHQSMNGAHEDIAMIHALQYLHKHDFDPQHTSIYSDDDLLGHAPTYLAKENYRGHYADIIRTRLTRAATFTGFGHDIDNMLRTLTQVRMHKVKGHQGHVYQERVNYLAKHQAHEAVGETLSFLPFEDWLKQGLVVYTSSKMKPSDEREYILDALGIAPEKTTPSKGAPPQSKIVHAPFVKNLLLSPTFSSPEP